MMRIAAMAAPIVGALVLTAAASAAAPTTQGRAPELDKLDFLIGDWTVEGRVFPVPGLPPGRTTATVHEEWSAPGKDFLVTTGTSSDPPDFKNENYIRVMGYDREKKAYTVHLATSGGFVENMTITIEGNVWTYHNIADNNANPNSIDYRKLKSHVIYTIVSPTVTKEVWEWQLDGKTWTPAVERIYTRKTK